MACLAALILFSYNWLAIGLGVASLALVAVYPFAKRFTWWPQVFLGLAFNWGALLMWAAQDGTIPPAALALYAALGFWWVPGLVRDAIVERGSAALGVPVTVGGSVFNGAAVVAAPPIVA